MVLHDVWCNLAGQGPGGSGNGHLDVQFQGNPRAAGNDGCTGGIDWPALDAVRIMGVNEVDTSSVTVQVWLHAWHLLQTGDVQVAGL